MPVHRNFACCDICADGIAIRMGGEFVYTTVQDEIAELPHVRVWPPENAEKVQALLERGGYVVDPQWASIGILAVIGRQAPATRALQ